MATNTAIFDMTIATALRMPNTKVGKLRTWAERLLSRDSHVSRSHAKMRTVVEPAQPSLESGAPIAGYVVEERIGVGGFGEVFRAKHPVIGREIAIKVLFAKYSADPQAVARFVAEARAVNKINHAGIVEVYDFGKLDDGREFYSMELLGGSTLRDLLDERGRIPLPEALPILRGIAAAVDAAHVAGIAHRDLKPDNVFVLEDGRTKLIDFGLAKLMNEHDGPTTRDGSVFGTPMYMSPEQCRGTAIDTRTDLYSFGVLAYRMLVGEAPFSGDAIELALHHVNDRPVAPSKRCPELPRYVDHVLLSLLSKDPIDRPASLGTAVSALEGSITLRRMRAKHVRRIVAVAALCTCLGFGAKELAFRHHDSVPSGRDRIAPMWNAEIRASLAKRFVGRADIVAGWPIIEKYIDRSTSRWARQWDEATHASDRTSDPLLYAQRLTCLENVLLDLHGQVDALAVTDPTHDRGSTPFGRTLEDCADANVLRSQVAAPPVGVRPAVGMLVLATYRAASEAVYTANERTSMEEALGQLDAIARLLTALHPPAAALPILLRTQTLVETTWDVASRQPRARAALADAIRRIEATRDDVSIAEIYGMQAYYLFDNERDGDASALGADALAHADEAAARAGHPPSLQRSLEFDRGMLELSRHNYDAAVRSFRAAEQALDPDDPFAALNVAVALPAALALGGHETEAVADARARLETAKRVFGVQSPFLRLFRVPLMMLEGYAGDLEGAAHDSEQLVFDRNVTGAPDYQNVWNRIAGIDLRLRIGKATEQEVVDAVHALAGLGTTPPTQSPDGLATARRAGHYASFAMAAEHDVASGTDEATDAAAYLAFGRGDAAKAKQLAEQMAERCAKRSCRDWMRRARWLAVTPGPTSDAQLAALEAQYDHSAFAMAASGIALASFGNWDAALGKLEAARAIPNTWERQADLVELATWLGLARAKHGDVDGARASFEQALDAISILHNGFDGFDYGIPIAEIELAKILWDAKDGDRPRARRLAARSIDGFARLGPFRERERQDAQRWLAVH